MEITNVGTADSKVGKVNVGYYPDNGKNKLFQKRNWSKESTTTTGNFHIPLAQGDGVLRIPNLKMLDSENENQNIYFVKIGDSAVGTSYHEQNSSWGNWYPRFEKLEK